MTSQHLLFLVPIVMGVVLVVVARRITHHRHS